MLRFDSCANCDLPITGKRRIYCSDRCGEFAVVIRWVRKLGGLEVIRASEEYDYAYRQRLRFILSDGYAAHHRISAATRALVIARDGATCKVCAKPGEHIDHIAATTPELFNEPENLQYLCANCHRIKTEEALILVRLTPQQQLWLHELEERISSPQPLRPCDDHEAWSIYYWRQTVQPDLRAGLKEHGMGHEEIDELIRQFQARKRTR